MNHTQTPRYLVRHVGNMGDMVFFIPPVLETLKRREPGCHITFVTAWGFKETKRHIRSPLQKYEFWGNRNQGGFSIHLMLTNPHIDQLVHWHDTHTDLAKNTCVEDGTAIATWSASYYEEQKGSNKFDAVYELDFGMGHEDNPIQRIYEAIGMPDEDYSNYKLYLSDADRAVARKVMADAPRPRIVLIEGLEKSDTRGWDSTKIPELERRIEQTYSVPPIWFGGKYNRMYRGRELTLRENIATIEHADAAIGVLSGPLHFTAALGVPTITLYADQIIRRAAPAWFLNPYINDTNMLHRTILGPTGSTRHFLKSGTTKQNLTPSEWASQGYRDWNRPGRQGTKSPLAVITVDEVMTVLQDVLPARS